MDTTILAVLLFLAGNAVGQQPLNTIEQVRELKPDAAAQGLPVAIESQIVWVDTLRGGFFLNNGQFGIYVRHRLKEGEVVSLKPGDMVRVVGITNEGGFAPEIIPETIEVIGREPIPDGNAFWSSHLFSAAVDCDWLAMRGRLVSYEVLKYPPAIVVQMVRNERTFYLQVPYSKENEKRLEQLMFQWVKFNAVAATVYNSNRQSVGRIFHVSSAAEFRIEGASLDEVLSIDEKARPIHELMQLGMNHLSAVKTYGTVTHVGEHEIFLRGENAALNVWMHETPSLAVGDVVEVVGLVWPQEVTPAFRAHSVRILRKEREPSPVKLESFSAVYDTLNYELVQVDAKLVEIGRSFGVVDPNIAPEPQIKLLCSSDGQLFEAQLPAGAELPEAVKVGSQVRLTGLCHVVRDYWRPWLMDISDCWLQPRSISDIELLSSPSWWTSGRLLWLAASALVISLLLSVWILLLRKTVDRQTRIIGDKIERETTLSERQRIARELHDTLEQGLTALSIQLRTLYRKLKKNPEEGLAGIEAVEKMLKVCRDESRASIQDLRGGLLEEMDLPAAIRKVLAPRLQDSGIDLRLEVDGVQRRFMLLVEHQLLRLVTEAASNAIKHASADTIRIRMRYAPDELSVTVEDDGCGFDPGTIDGAEHFGLRGMYERANRLNAILKIESEINRGTLVQLSMPVDEKVERKINE